MKNLNNYYLEMPRGLLFDYDLSAGALRLYYLLKEMEQRFCDYDRNTFYCSDKELIRLLKTGKNQLYKYKNELRSKGLIKVGYNNYGLCQYLLPYLTEPVEPFEKFARDYYS